MKTLSTFTFPKGQHWTAHAVNTISQEHRECIMICGRRVNMDQTGFSDSFKQRQKLEKVTCLSCKRGM